MAALRAFMQDRNAIEQEDFEFAIGESKIKTLAA
jgi:hypothetical protein